MRILVGGQKGGTGKSTLATNLAVMLQAAGADVHLVDCDKQASAVRFAQRREEHGRPVLAHTHLMGREIGLPLAAIADAHEAVVVDCGGQDSVELRAGMVSPAMQTMVIPVQAGHFDLETLVEMDRLVAVAKTKNRGLTAWVVINRAPTHHLVTVHDQARTFVAESMGHLQLLPVTLFNRMSYGYAASVGDAVVEYEPRGKAAEELRQLFKALTGRQFASAAAAEEVAHG